MKILLFNKNFQTWDTNHQIRKHLSQFYWWLEVNSPYNQCHSNYSTRISCLLQIIPFISFIWLKASIEGLRRRQPIRNTALRERLKQKEAIKIYSKRKNRNEYTRESSKAGKKEKNNTEINFCRDWFIVTLISVNQKKKFFLWSLLSGQ